MSDLQSTAPRTDPPDRHQSAAGCGKGLGGRGRTGGRGFHRAQCPAKPCCATRSFARADSTPVCQDTGTPIFYVNYPQAYSTIELKATMRAAVAEATHKHYLRPNAVDSLTGRNSGDNLGDAYFPEFHFEEHTGRRPAHHPAAQGRRLRERRLPICPAGRAPQSRPRPGRGAQGRPGRGLSGPGPRLCSRFSGHRHRRRPRHIFRWLPKRSFWIKIGEHHIDPEIAALEARITREANQLDIGPMGLGGHTTVLGTRITQHAPPARLLFRQHNLHVLGLPPPQPDRSLRKGDL